MENCHMRHIYGDSWLAIFHFIYKTACMVAHFNLLWNLGSTIKGLLLSSQSPLPRTMRDLLWTRAHRYWYISLFWNSPGSLLGPMYCLFVFLSLVLLPLYVFVIVSFCLSSSLVHLSLFTSWDLVWKPSEHLCKRLPSHWSRAGFL